MSETPIGDAVAAELDVENPSVPLCPECGSPHPFPGACRDDAAPPAPPADAPADASDDHGDVAEGDDSEEDLDDEEGSTTEDGAPDA